METNTPRKFENFVLPTGGDIRKKYTARVEKPTQADSAGQWPRSIVTIELHHEDGSVEDIYSYHRNYSFYNTFEPFRQFKNSKWTDYALISPNYISFEILNLETREIVAKLPTPTVKEKDHDRWRAMGHEKWCEEQPIGTEKPGWGFCPIDFYVKDWFEDNNEESTQIASAVREGQWLYSEENLLEDSGQYALYAGCMWGDDYAYKLRYIDLSKISEGIVTEDDRFGYLPLATDSLEGNRLRDRVEIYDGHHMTIPLQADINLKTHGITIGDEEFSTAK